MTDSVEEEEDLLEFVIFNGNSVLSIGNRMNCTTVVFKFLVTARRIPESKSIFGALLHLIFSPTLSAWCTFQETLFNYKFKTILILNL